MATGPADKLQIPRREELPGGWAGLAAAIIYQACEDYRTNRRALRRHPDSRAAAAEKRRLERFFTSRWFRNLTDLDGKDLLRQLKEESTK